MKMKTYFPYYLFFCLFNPFLVTAQQFGFYGMHQKNWHIINPAAPNLAFIQTNKAENILNLSYRQQWIGLRGSPSNSNAHFETMVIDSREKLNIKYGFGLYGETIGALQNNTLYFNYAYPITIKSSRRFRSKSKLYIGFNAGYLQQRINFANERFADGIDETIESVIKEQKLFGGQSFFELSPGLFFTNGENFYMGLSSPRLIRTGQIGGSLKVINTQPQAHFILGTYNKDRTIQPSMWLRWQSNIDYQSIIKNNPISATFNFKSQISQSLTLGLGVSTGRWVHFEGGWQLRDNNGSEKPLQISFGYDLPFYKTGLNLGQTAEMNFVFFF